MEKEIIEFLNNNGLFKRLVEPKCNRWKILNLNRSTELVFIFLCGGKN